MRLDLRRNGAAAMFVRNRGCGDVGCGFQFAGVAGLNFIAKRRSLTISDSRNARRGSTALLGARLDLDTGEARGLELATDQRRIVVAVRRARQKARRIVWKKFGESIRHIIREHVLLDAVPYVEYEMPA